MCVGTGLAGPFREALWPGSGRWLSSCPAWIPILASLRELLTL